jgi:phospholipase C
MARRWIRLALALVAGLCGMIAWGTPTLAAAPHLPRYKHVFYIVEENHSFTDIIGNAAAPNLTSLARTYGLATDYYGTSHPSEPNYVAMIGGSDFGIKDDGPYTTNVVAQPSLADQLEGAGLSWKSYSQSMPSAGFTGTCYPCNASDPSTLYASKHNPFLNFAGVQHDSAELQKLVPIDQFGADLAHRTVPTLSFIVPDQCHDMHGTNDCPDTSTNIKVADDYAGQLVSSIMASPAWKDGQNAIVITWDEGNDNGGCCRANPGGGRIPTIVITTHGPRGLTYDVPSNHYSMLLTLQQMFGLGCLQNTCDTADVTPVTPLFSVDGYGSTSSG